jgi:hypothetical protein
MSNTGTNQRPVAVFVLDVSACMPWCCEDESTPASEKLLRRAGDGDRRGGNVRLR